MLYADVPTRHKACAWENADLYPHQHPHFTTWKIRTSAFYRGLILLT